MAVIDKANAFFLRPVNTGSPFTESTAVAYDDSYAAQVQAASNILDFGAPESGAYNLAGYLNVLTAGGESVTVTLQDSEDMSSWAPVAGFTITTDKVASAAMPAHRRFVKAVLAPEGAAATTDVYIGARADIVK